MEIIPTPEETHTSTMLGNEAITVKAASVRRR
jgi:hypothetical protein